MISIIVPVYNVEAYLPQCLDSLIHQTYKDIEIVCVNDGSKDRSLEILKEYANKDERIKIINQENQGLLPARPLLGATPTPRHSPSVRAQGPWPQRRPQRRGAPRHLPHQMHG